MAGRKNRIGLDYFSLECTFKKDDIELIEAKCGLVAFAVIVKLWQKIYRNGYFIKFDDDNMMLFSRKIMHPIDDIEKIIQECFKRELFDQDIYLRYRILTGQGIQRRYLEACKICKRKRITINPELMLINPEEMDINSELIYEDSELLPQSKVKRKERERKEKGKESKKLSLSKVFTSDSEEIRLSNFLFNHILKNNPDAKKPNFQKWAKDFDAILRIDKRALEKVKEVIKWSQDDSFWKANILSPGKLRDKFDQLLVKSKDASEPVLFSDITKQNIATGQEWLNGK